MLNLSSGLQVAISPPTAGMAILAAISERKPAAPSWKPLIDARFNCARILLPEVRDV